MMINEHIFLSYVRGLVCINPLKKIVPRSIVYFLSVRDQKLMWEKNKPLLKIRELYTTIFRNKVLWPENHSWNAMGSTIYSTLFKKENKTKAARDFSPI